MFNGCIHYDEDFCPLDHLSLADQAIYQARVAKYRPHFKWSPALDKLFNLCFVHADRNVPGKVSYFANLDAFRTDRLTRTSPEMFMERWLAYAPSNIRTIWGAETLGKMLPTIEFIENTNPDGWYNVYVNGPASCMRGSEDVKAYAHPENNLALAYLKHPEYEGSFIARTIVNKKKMKYVRIYAKEGKADLFAAALNMLGYERDYNEALEGEVIHVGYAECVGCGEQILIGPYLDNADRCVDLRADGRSGIISSNGEPLRSNNDGDGYACPDCA